jgi:hypothetical protein
VERNRLYRLTFTESIRLLAWRRLAVLDESIKETGLATTDASLAVKKIDGPEEKAVGCDEIREKSAAALIQ